MPKCPECDRGFATEAALAQHLKDKHGLATDQAKPTPEGEQPKTTKKQKTLRRRNRHPVAIGLVAVGIVVGLGIYLVAAPAFAQPPFACISEGSYVHIHPYVEIWVDGQNVTIPSDVGITQGGSCLEPIHTHDATGILHLELSSSDLSHNWTLGDFFSIWQYSCKVQSSSCPVVNGTARPVVFNQTDILGFRADSTHTVSLLINGTANSSWGNLPLLHYAYCTSSRASSFPCSSSAGGDPAWDCVSAASCGTYPYKTGNIIVLDYAKA